jgi:acetyltransferase
MLSPTMTLRHYLHSLVTPKSVALIGASERPGSLGRLVFENLLAGGLGGELIPINLRQKEVLGHRAVKSLAALARPVQLAASRQGVRFVGPDSFGLIRTDLGLNATVGATPPLPGRLALIAQSGAVCGALLDFARPVGIGFSSVIALGHTLDVDFGELLNALAEDPATDAARGAPIHVGAAGGRA